MKKILFLITLLLIFVVSCDFNNNNNNQDIVDECTHPSSTWVWEENSKCSKECFKFLYCDSCHEIIDQISLIKEHELVTEIIPATCLKDGYNITTCKNCLYETTSDYTTKTGHNIQYIIDREATSELYGIKHMGCINCDLNNGDIEYTNNDYKTHGALHVSGINLVDQNNELFRLAGVSTFGLQWQPQYVNKSTFENLKNEFGANVVRLALYTSENGYCTGSEAKKQEMYQTVVNGINYATELDMYVIVDWHMLGADDNGQGDNNPLYFKDESIAFFDKITKEFKDYNNILFEIMNEPSYCTWKDCKTYAESVIPVIRKNMPNAVILVGNPQWSSDLASVANDPLTYENIMYTFHFYAGDNCMTSKITKACGTDKLPVFVTEHGAMDASGYGELDYNSIKKWYEVLDKYNISFVAWSLANLDSSSCMFKTGSTKYDDFSNANLKPWGVYYKNRVRKIMGLPLDV